jgi:hypothetical protein
MELGLSDAWQPLVTELDRWHQSGKQVRFWLRDDDAIEPSSELDRLLKLSDQDAVPVCLAVIPKFTGKELASYLNGIKTVRVAVHGWAHEDHALPGSKKIELGGERSEAVILEELRQGHERLSLLHEERFVPILVPPWNRIDPALIPHLKSIDFEALSVFGPECPSAIREINTHVDLMNWHGGRCGHDTETLVPMIIDRLKYCHDNGGVVGILTHHLVHDQQAWTFLDALFRITSSHPAAEWCDIKSIMNQSE